MDEDADNGFALPESFLQQAAEQESQAQHNQVAVKAQATAPAVAQTMLCCECGAVIEVNPSALCVNCIRTKVDISDGIPKQAVIYFCRGCERYLNPPNSWIVADLESRELLSFCLKRLRGLSKVKLIDAGFIWTEPHSKRVKVKITVQKEVMNGAILQQVFVVEFVINHQMCEDCHRREAKDTWTCVVQLRQKVPHKKTFFYLEQLIIKHRAQRDAVNILSRPDGVDFFYSCKQHGKRLIDFLAASSPCRSKASERLIGADVHTSTYNFKYSLSVEVVPICRGDVVCLHPEAARKNGNLPPLCICDNVGSVIHLIDPRTLQTAEIKSDSFWRRPFGSICTFKEQSEYMVLDVEPVLNDRRQPVTKGKMALCDVTVARLSDVEVNDTQFITRSHLGNILQPGDNVWAFDVLRGNVNDDYFDKLDPRELPDFILIRKSYSERRRKNRRRKWKLKTVVTQVEEGNKKDIEQGARDYENFLQDLEENPDMRQNINIYRDANYTAPTESEVDDEELRISLEEMLDEFDTLDLATAPGADGGATEDRVGGSDVPSKRLRRQLDPVKPDDALTSEMELAGLHSSSIVTAPTGAQ